MGKKMIDLPDDLMVDIKVYAAINRMSAQNLIKIAIEHYLASNRTTAPTNISFEEKQPTPAKASVKISRMTDGVSAKGSPVNNDLDSF